jgi:hypothetical protein
MTGAPSSLLLALTLSHQSDGTLATLMFLETDSPEVTFHFAHPGLVKSLLEFRLAGVTCISKIYK